MTDSPPSKSPLLAAVLNLIPQPFALGYIYLGHWERFNWALVLRVASVIATFFILLVMVFNCAWDSSCSESWLFFGLPSLIPAAILFFSVFDAYILARRHNRRVAESRTAEDTADS